MKSNLNDKDIMSRLGGFKHLLIILDRFYDKLLEDVWVGYIFRPFDKQKLVLDQAEFINRSFGGPPRNYKPRNLNQIHKPLNITSGHFDRRHNILKETLDEFNIDEDIVQTWLQLDLKFKSIVINR